MVLQKGKKKVKKNTHTHCMLMNEKKKNSKKQWILKSYNDLLKQIGV